MAYAHLRTHDSYITITIEYLRTQDLWFNQQCHGLVDINMFGWTKWLYPIQPQFPITTILSLPIKMAIPSYPTKNKQKFFLQNALKDQPKWPPIFWLISHHTAINSLRLSSAFANQTITVSFIFVRATNHSEDSMLRQKTQGKNNSNQQNTRTKKQRREKTSLSRLW